jgi:site-specific DNA-methyltransferase (adenine-specific)
MCGNSCDLKTVKKICDKNIDMVFTDPPYNFASERGKFSASDTRPSYQSLQDSEWDHYFDIKPFLENIKLIINKATIYIWTSHYLFGEIYEYLKDWADYSSYVVWAKPNPMPSLSKKHPAWSTELCNYFTKGNNRIVNYPKEGNFLSHQTFTSSKNNLHPTQKSIELVATFLKLNSNKGSYVFDGFGGSGTTLMACEQLERFCRMIEIDPNYINVIIDRWEKLTGKKAVKIGKN